MGLLLLILFKYFWIGANICYVPILIQVAWIRVPLPPGWGYASISPTPCLIPVCSRLLSGMYLILCHMYIWYEGCYVWNLLLCTPSWVKSDIYGCHWCFFVLCWGVLFLSFSYMMAIILFMVPSSTVSFLDITLFLSGPSSCICTRWLWGSWYFFGVTGINILYICWRDAFSIASNAARSDSETRLITYWIFCLLCYARIGCFGNVDIFRE